MPHNPLIDAPAEASPEELAARRAAALAPVKPKRDLPAEISPLALQARQAVEERIAARQAQPQQPAPAEEMPAAGRFAGAAGGSIIGAMGGGDAAAALQLLAKAGKRAAVAHKLNQSTGGRLATEALDVVGEAAGEWAKGALAVKDFLLPPEKQKGDLAERAGGFVGGLLGIGGVASKFGALGLGATGAGQAALPVYFEVLSKTGSEEKAVQAALPSLGVGATYALPAGKILSKAGSGAFGRLLLAASAEGGLGAAQGGILTKIVEKATGEELDEAQRAIEDGTWGFLTTLGVELLTRGKAKLSKGRPKSDAAPAPSAEGAAAPEAQQAPTPLAPQSTEAPPPPTGQAQVAPEATTGATPTTEAGAPTATPDLTATARGIPEAAASARTEVSEPSPEATSKLDAWGKMAEKMEGSGWKFIDSEDQAAIRYGGTSFPTFERGPVKVGFSRRSMVEKDGSVYEQDVRLPPDQLMLDAITVDPSARGKGEASRAFLEMLAIADESGLTLHLEPAPIRSIAGKKLSRSQLVEWYKRHGFQQRKAGSDKLLIRRPNKAPSHQATPSPESGAEEKAKAPWEQTREEFEAQNPHSITKGSTAQTRGEAFDKLPDDAEVWVYHATDDATADKMLAEGVRQADKPRTLAAERYAAGEDASFQPGAGLGRGTYVGAEPVSVDGYGRRILAFKVKKGDIRIPPEGQILGKKSPGLALADSDAFIETDLPASSVVDVTEKGRSGRRGHEAFVRKAISEGKKVPKAIAEGYGLEVAGGAETAQVYRPEQVSEPSKTTGIRNSAVEKELEEMGLPLPEKGERRGFVELHAKAKETFEKSGGEAGRELVAKLEAEPRAPTDAEDALLSFEANRLKQERVAAEKAFLKEPSEANQRRIDAAQAEYARAANVFDRAGKESGRSLNARKMMLKEDYSLAEMERQVSIAKGGKKLTKEEGAKVKELHERIALTEKALADYTTQAEMRAKELEARAALAEAKAFAAKESRKAGHKERRASIAQSKARIDEIINKLAGGQKAAAGLDPEKIKLTFQLAAEYVKLGYHNFKLFADEVVARLGEGIRPHLQKAWDDANAASDEELLRRYKARKETDIAKLKERTREGVFETKRRKTPVEKDPEAVELQVEYEAAKRAFEREREVVRRRNRTRTQKALDLGREALALPRAIKFSFDLPPIFRQAARFAVPDIFFNPKRLASFTAQGISAASKRRAARIDVELRRNKLTPLAEAGGLDLPRVEEEMDSWLARKLPGIGGSSRIYNTFMNLYRMSAFEGLLKGIDNPTLDDARTAARAVNVLTGRGNPTGKIASLVDGLGAVLTSPRLLLSNIQTLAGSPLYSGSRRVRKQIAKQYARALTGYATLYGMVELVDQLDDEDDVRVVWDPRSSDFGKIIVGEKRFDVMGGLSQIITLGSRVATGVTVDTKGKAKANRGPKKDFKAKNALELGAEFMRYKLSPVFSTAADLATGTQVERGPGGKEIPPDAESIAEGLVAPISFEDIFDDMKRYGVDDTLAMRLIGLWGVGARDYGDREKKAYR